jgi:hypothetical protein
MSRVLSAFVGAVAAMGFTCLRDRADDASPQEIRTSEVLRAKTIEIVDDAGRLAGRLSSNENGGTIELIRPSAGASGRVFAWVGCSFTGGAEITLLDPQAFSEAKLMVSVDGKPAAASVSGYGVSGSPTFKIGSRSDEDPTITVWDMKTGEPRFEK